LKGIKEDQEAKEVLSDKVCR